MISDESLMLQFKDGSREAFEELFQRYREPLYGFFCRRLNNRSRAEELRQETFVAVIRSRLRYEPKAQLRTYNYGIALKMVSAERRNQVRRQNEIPPHIVQPSTDSAIWVHAALDKLDPMDREVLMLREYEELSYAQIADVLHLPLNTVRSRLFRARVSLKDLLTAKESAGGLSK